MQELIEKFLNRTISKSERKQLKKWVLANNDNLQIFKSEIKKRSENNLYHHFDESEAFQLFLASIDERKSKKIAVNRMLKYAAIVIGVLTVGILLTQFIGEPTEATIVQTEQQDSDALEQITITLADGSQQVITQDGSTQLLDKNGRAIAQKQDQGLDFSNTSESVSSNLVFNEIYVPYGQTFKLTLSDGTKVWLNAGTSLRFPQFLNTSTQNRVVYLNGEAYFDVAKDKDRPFIVNAENLDIEVLGTQFNVSAYKSDGEIATTLVEGSVSVYENSNPDTKVLLSPSYQASFVKENGSITRNKVDTRIYTGWMENLLIIDNLSFAQILDKLERSHNVSIINNATHLEGEIFNGEFENESINSILGTIASSTPFTYTIENNVITISK
ncbi:FecR family protein [Flagellimonas flava]|uniref:FecR family protein n=1 Tax=Flagellimonas flava TaxID=570519 RepID=UPI003D661EFD